MNEEKSSFQSVVREQEVEVDEVRRKLLRATAVLGGAFAAGQFPYRSPAVKSFFGTRTAWAQPSVITPVVQVTQPTNLPIVIVIGGPVPIQSKGAAAKVSAALPDSATGTFSVENTGDVPVLFKAPTITGSGAEDFSIDGAELDGNPAMAPFEMQPGQVVIVTVRYTCGTEGVLSEATVVLDITTLEGGPVDGVEDVPVSGKCGTLSCALECVEAGGDFCFDSEGFEINLRFDNNSEIFNVRNTGTLAIVLTAIEISPATPTITLTAMTGTIAPGDALEQRVDLVCGETGSRVQGVGPGYAIVPSAESADLVDGTPIPVDCGEGTVFADCIQPE